MKLLLFICFCCFYQQKIISQSNLIRSTTGISGSSVVIDNDNKSYLIQQSIGQTSPIGTSNNGTYTLRQGFIQPDVMAKIIDINIPIDLSLNIYPNPFNKIISLSFNEEVKTEIRIEVFDIRGRQVHLEAFQKSMKIEVKLDKLPSAEYILKVKANNKQFFEQVIKN